MDISVIILTFNGEPYIRDCLESVQNQDLDPANYEIIVADNASQDHTREVIIEQFPGVRLLSLQKNHGFAKGNNLAVQEARGRFLAFLNQDTVVGRRWLSTLSRALQNHPDFAALQSNQLLPWNPEYDPGQPDRIPETTYFFELTRFGYAEQHKVPAGEAVQETRFVSGACFMLRRSALFPNEPVFDQRIGSYNEDMELSFRLLERGYKLGAVPGSLVHHKNDAGLALSGKNLSRHARIIHNRVYVYAKVLPFRRFLRRLPLLTAAQSLKAFHRLRGQGHHPAAALGLGAALLPLSLACVPAGLAGTILRVDCNRILRKRFRSLPPWLAERINPAEAGLRRFVVQAASEIPQEGRVLDAGCGEGGYRTYFSTQRYIGVDSGQGDQSWDYSRLNATADLSALPFPRDLFAAVICIQVLEHLAEPGQALAEFHRVLEPGGRLYLSAPQGWCEHQRPYDYFRFTSFGLEHLLTKAGFEAIRITPSCGYFGYLANRLTFLPKVLFWSIRSPGLRLLFMPLEIAVTAVCVLILPLLLLPLDRLDRERLFTLNYLVTARKAEPHE